MKLASKSAQEENEQMQAARNDWIANQLESVAKKLGKPLTSVTPGFDLIGSWDLRQQTEKGTAEPVRYHFVDSDTVMVDAPVAGEKPWEKWYFRSPGSVAISGTAYLMALTDDQILVLIPSNNSDTFMVATRVESEPSDESQTAE